MTVSQFSVCALIELIKRGDSLQKKGNNQTGSDFMGKNMHAKNKMVINFANICGASNMFIVFCTEYWEMKASFKPPVQA